MESRIKYDIYKAIHQEKKITEIYIDSEEFEWFYAVGHYTATCTEAIDFTLFDKTICALLQIEGSLSLEEIGIILGFNVIDKPSEQKYKDLAEYEILKEALVSLESYEMIDGGDLDFSYCTLTSMGKEYVTKGKKFKIHQNKGFKLYFDYTSGNHAKAKENFEFIRGERTNNQIPLDFEDEVFLKSFAEYQIPDIYNPDKLNSFKDVKLIGLDYFKARLYKVFLLDVLMGKIRMLVYDPIGKIINDFFTEYITETTKDNELVDIIKEKYPFVELNDTEDKLTTDLNRFQEKIETSLEEVNITDIKELLDDYYQNVTYIEPLTFFSEINQFIKEANTEVWLLLRDTYSIDTETLEETIRNNSNKVFFIYLKRSQNSQSLLNKIEKFKNAYIQLVDEVKEFNVIFRDKNHLWNVFKEGWFRVPILRGEQKAGIEQLFIYRNLSEDDLDRECLNNFREDFASHYVPNTYEEIKNSLACFNTRNEITKEEFECIKELGEELLPFKHLVSYEKYFSDLETLKNRIIQAILKNREDKVNETIDSLSKRLSGDNSLTIRSVENVERILLQEKNKFLEEEAPLFRHLEEKISEIKKDLEIARMRKSIIIDTNILLENPNIIELIGSEQRIIFSGKVLDELDSMKERPNLKEQAQKAIRNIHKHQQDKNILFKTSKINNLSEDFDPKSPDNIILSVARQYRKNNPILLTNDKGMSLKAKAMRIPAKNIDELQTILGMSKSSRKNKHKKRK